MKLSQLKDGDCPPYYKTYLDTLSPDTELHQQLESQLENFPQFIASIPGDKWHYRYEAGKWTVAEVLVHVLDTERVFQYRALRLGRKDPTPMAGFDQDAWVPNSRSHSHSPAEMIEEYRAIRTSTLLLFRYFEEADLSWKGTASGVPISLGALGFIICGHQKHHRNILRSRYLGRS
ncbi:MAG TPA: DinB family protein [Robiginitalea sp.]|nr:DinB family protein [Robiginitalea sp.]